MQRIYSNQLCSWHWKVMTLGNKVTWQIDWIAYDTTTNDESMQDLNQSPGISSKVQHQPNHYYLDDTAPDLRIPVTWDSTPPHPHPVFLAWFLDQYGIWVRIGPPHPCICCKRWLNGEVRNETHKNRGPVSQQVWHKKDPSPISKALSAEHRPKFYSPSPVMVTSPYEWNFELDIKQ
jgi:hypothetical protein